MLFHRGLLILFALLIRFVKRERFFFLTITENPFYLQRWRAIFDLFLISPFAFIEMKIFLVLFCNKF